MAEPPYLAIAASIRRQIEAGELTPGDRVPSTRQLAHEWGVAIATATKALTTLRHAGVVVARARSGTVVAPTAGSAPIHPANSPTDPAGPFPDRLNGPEMDPERSRIIEAAIDIADADGLAAVSMRAVSARLGVATMTVYRHVRDKDDLLLRMSDAAYGTLAIPDDPPSGWRPRIELTARRLWEIHKRHPWLSQVTPLTRPVPLPNHLAYSEAVLSPLVANGVNAATAFDLTVLFYGYVIGMAAHLTAEEQATATSGMSDEQWMTARVPALQEIVAAGRFPTFGTTLAELNQQGGYDLELDRLFELGLQLLLDGVATLITHDTGVD